MTPRIESRLYCFVRMALSFSLASWLSWDIVTTDVSELGSNQSAESTALMAMTIAVSLAVMGWAWFLRETRVWRRLIAAEYPPLQQVLDESDPWV